VTISSWGLPLDQSICLRPSPARCKQSDWLAYRVTCWH
jgi:hypothetical protein